MMGSPGGLSRLISIVPGYCRVRLDAPDGFLLRGCRCGAATTTRFSSRVSNRSGLEILRGILPRIYVISLYVSWRQRQIRNDSVTAADETFGRI